MDQQLVKISCCNTCTGIVRASDPERLVKNAKMRNEFLKEVMKHNLAIKEIALSEYQKTEWCKCK